MSDNKDKNKTDAQNANPIDLMVDDQSEADLKSTLGGNKKRKRKKKKNPAMIIFVVVVVGFIMYIELHSSSSSATTDKKQTTKTSTSSYELRQAQSANNQLLANMGKQTKIIINKIGQLKLEKKQVSTSFNNQADQSLLRAAALKKKEIQVRMNAPMQMSFKMQKPNTNTVAGSASNQPVSGLTKGSNGARFANAQAKSYSSVKAEKIAHPDTTILQGEMLHAVLTVAINNELAGMIEATLTRPVYSYTQARVLLPIGSRIVGQFRAGGSNGGSTRIYAIWNRIITPNGISVMINSTSTDTLGRSGLKADAINTHFFKMFGTATLISLIGASASAGKQAGANSLASSTQDQYKQAITQSMGQVANKVLAKNLSIPPTMYVNQGKKINVFVAHDLDFYSLINSGK